MVLVDSSIWIEASRRTGSLEVKVGIEGLLDAYEAALCSPVMLEVLGGARKEERKQLNSDFSCLPYIRVTEADYIAAVRHNWNLRDAGITAPANDVLIATIAVRLMCRVYVQDKHFDAMAPVLGFNLYEPGYGGSFRPDGG
jgi:predicted nucleic acid-binding protein